MKTNFFTAMAPILGAMNLSFTLATSDDGTIIVSVLPQPKINDSAKENIVPLIIKGTIDELDEGFFEAIQKPITKVNGITVEIKSFEASSAKFAKENEAAKKIKDDAKKNKDKIDKLVKEAIEFIEKDDMEAAERKVFAINKLNPDNADAKNLTEQIDKSKLAKTQSNLFDVIDEVEKDLPESPNELERENSRVASGLGEENIEVIEQEFADKWNLNNETQTLG